MEKWSFNDSLIWENEYPTCSGNKQSPINITSETCIGCDLLCQLKFSNKPSKCSVAFQNGMVKVNCTGSSVTMNGIVYNLKSNMELGRPAISIHIPSLHTIDNRKFDVEIVMTYASFSEGPKSKNNGIIVSRLLNRYGGDYGPCNDFISQFINQIPTESLTSYLPVPVSPQWGAHMLIPSKKSFYSYEGSIPYPLNVVGCLENYRWVVFTDIDNIGQTNFEILQQNIGSDTRPIQSLNGRQIFFNNGDKDTILNELENPPFSTDRFLKCKKTPHTKKKPLKTIVINEIDETGISSNTLNNIRNILLLITVILMLVLAYYFVKLLYKRFWVQKMLRKMAGSDKISNNVWLAWKDTRKIYTKNLVTKPSSEV
jgi:carbonic anhydrase